jgi:hypothetical protein
MERLRCLRTAHGWKIPYLQASNEVPSIGQFINNIADPEFFPNPNISIPDSEPTRHRIPDLQ